MQTIRNIPYMPDIDKWKFSTIDIIGSIDFVGIDTFLVDGKYKIHYADSSEVFAKIIKLKNVSLSESSNDMALVFDSTAVYVPLSLDAQVGDSIFISKYSAAFDLECYYHSNIHGLFTGIFSLKQETSSLLKKK